MPSSLVFKRQRQQQKVENKMSTDSIEMLVGFEDRSEALLFITLSDAVDSENGHEVAQHSTE